MFATVVRGVRSFVRQMRFHATPKRREACPTAVALARITRNAAPEFRTPRSRVDVLLYCLLRCLERNFLHVHVVADHCAEHATGHTADHRALELVSARYRADRGTGNAADDRATL